MFLRPHRLSDGTLVLIRRIRAEDRARLVTGLRRLSEATRHKRFLSPKPRLSGSELTYLTEVDFQDHYALVAVLAEDPNSIVASARWIRDADDPAAAEVAVVVSDQLQGLGLGTELGTLLAEAARERGVERFTATMLADNVAAQRLFEHVSSELSYRSTGSVRELSALLAA
jgi:RimJ/RimL family protein N-acetyltransferase